MSAIPSLSAFHHWLLASPGSACPSRTVILHGPSPDAIDPMIQEIADYLNEYDEDGEGRWLAATPELVRQISSDADSRKLLGMADPCPNCPPHGACGIGKTLTALSHRGYVVFRAETPANKPLDLPHAFHAGIGAAECDAPRCHLVLNPDLVQPRSLAHLVSDVFLDWHHESDCAASIPSSRNAPPSAIQDQTGFPDAASF
ncbi:MAG: hypothetical protein V4640_09610 [Verrucomicrobiota bacterium]